jgi:serine/threonine protein phosphatase 1
MVARLKLWNLLTLQKSDPRPALVAARLRRIALSHEPSAIYAIGDVHGCLDKLRRLEEKLVEDGRTIDGAKLIVMLGDYVDRGPESAAVVDHLMGPMPVGFVRQCLRGNHETMFLDYLDKSLELDTWMAFGGAHTILSYGLDIEYLVSEMGFETRMIADEFRSAVPASHVGFLQSLPVCLETPRYFFSHAGARPGVPLSNQSDFDLMWIREDFLEHAELPFGKTIVHGHSPEARATISQYRIGVDTAAFTGGPLTAARIVAGRVDIIEAT